MSTYQPKASSKQIKVVFVGDSSVGKTCIALRAVNDSFSDGISPTVGGAHLSLTMHSERMGEDVNFSIWDTAGQEEFRTLVPLYFQNADVCFVTFDLTNEDSFNHIDDWLRILHKSAPETVEIVLIGNKLDLAERENGLKRIISFDMGLSFSHEIGAIMYMETSALTGQNVKELFEQLAEDEFLMNKRTETAPKGVDISQPLQIEGNNDGNGGFGNYYLERCGC